MIYDDRWWFKIVIFQSKRLNNQRAPVSWIDCGPNIHTFWAEQAPKTNHVMRGCVADRGPSLGVYNPFMAFMANLGDDGPYGFTDTSSIRLDDAWFWSWWGFDCSYHKLRHQEMWDLTWTCINLLCQGQQIQLPGSGSQKLCDDM